MINQLPGCGYSAGRHHCSPISISVSGVCGLALIASLASDHRTELTHCGELRQISSTKWWDECAACSHSHRPSGASIVTIARYIHLSIVTDPRLRQQRIDSLMNRLVADVSADARAVKCSAGVASLSASRATTSLESESPLNRP